MFLWGFHATFRTNGSPLVTHGREAQVLRRNGGAWRIVHAHYSNMPVTGEGQGF